MELNTLTSKETRSKSINKQIWLFIILLLSPVLIYNFYKPALTEETQPPSTPAPYENHNIYDKFILGAMDEETGAHNQGYSTTDSLELNISHAYTSAQWLNINGINRYVPKGRTPSDLMLSNVDSYKLEVTNYLKNIYTHNGRRSITQRPKIQWLCYGQSSVYQAEPIPAGNDLWFYSYNHNDVGDTVRDGHRTVIYCRPANSTNQGNWVDNPGDVVRGLKANTEQCNPSDNFDGDMNCEWIIKPCIRIDSAFANNPANWNKTVCKIIVNNHDENLIKSTEIKVINFKKDQFTRYDGQYLEEFFFGANDSDLTFRGNLGDKWWLEARGTNPTDAGLANKTDIKVEWLGNCDMWLDYVKVENDIANKLLRVNDNYDNWIQDEVEKIAFAEDPGSVPLLLKFYIELTEFNNLPCMAYVNSKLKEYSESYSGGNYSVDLMADFTYTNLAHIALHQQFTILDADWIYRNYVNKVGFTQFFAESYELNSKFGIGGNYSTWCKIPETLPPSSNQYELAMRRPVTEYEDWMQYQFNRSPYFFEVNNYWDNDCQDNGCGIVCQDAGMFKWIMKIGNEISRDHNIPFIFMPQGQLWYLPVEVRREPTNEELNMMANVAVSYGARGLQWFWFRSTDGAAPCPPEFSPYSKGMVESNGYLRTTNVYGQSYPKWKVFRDISLRMKSWESNLLSFVNSGNYSYIYDIETERNALQGSSYMNFIYTYEPGEGPNPCGDYPAGLNPPSGYKLECADSRYVQAAIFERPANEFNNYFMLVNRRCSPYYPVGDPLYPDGENGGARLMAIQFNPAAGELDGYNNWAITEIGNLSARRIIFRKDQPLVDMGEFMPGEGRLYKMAPLPIEGGIMVGDEVMGGVNITCEDTIFNDGHNITIGGNTSILFNDTSKMVINGGSITIGDLETSNTITLGSVTGNAWHGLELNNCEVRIYNTTFTGLANDTTYAINAIDCPVLDVRNCTFNINSNLKGGIKAVYYEESEIDNIYIGGNTFNFAGSTLEAVNVSGYAGMTTPLIVENNTIIEGNIAILLSGITGGAVKSNALYENNIAISLLTSSVDVSGNTIYSEIDNAIGIFTADGVAKLNPSGELNFGGQNNITNTGTGTNNIKLENGYFLMDGGENIFNISDDQTSYHLYGYFPLSDEISTDASNNCFKLSGSQVDPPVQYVTWGEQGEQVDFNFSPYLSTCEQTEQNNFIVLDIGNSIYDTIGTTGGEGGSHSSRYVI
ncbi:MAG: hypothetical protein K8I03_03540 [Ignavibacteria bacterium]|nr:hypothetical protein [Ignavibacteria bacterium]